MALVLKSMKWVIGCWFFIIGLAMLIAVKEYDSVSPLIITIFCAGVDIVLFKTDEVKKELFFTSVVLMGIAAVVAYVGATYFGIEYKNFYVSWSLVLAVIGGPAMYFAYDKWD